MSHPSISDEIVADEYCGSDPFGRSHYTDESARKYTMANPQRGTDNDLWPTNSGIFKTFETARSHLDGGLRNVEVGYPQFYWEGTPQYADALGRNISKAVSGQLTSQQALDEAAEEWVKIVQKLGIDNQKRQYENFLLVQENLVIKSDALLSVPIRALTLPPSFVYIYSHMTSEQSRHLYLQLLRVRTLKTASVNCF